MHIWSLASWLTSTRMDSPRERWLSHSVGPFKSSTLGQTSNKPRVDVIVAVATSSKPTFLAASTVDARQSNAPRILELINLFTHSYQNITIRTWEWLVKIPANPHPHLEDDVIVSDKWPSPASTLSPSPIINVAVPVVHPEHFCDLDLWKIVRNNAQDHLNPTHNHQTVFG